MQERHFINKISAKESTVHFIFLCSYEYLRVDCLSSWCVEISAKRAHWASSTKWKKVHFIRSCEDSKFYSSLPQMYLISLNTATVVNMGQAILPETSTSFHVKVGKSLGKIPIACPGSVMKGFIKICVLSHTSRVSLWCQ